MPAGRYIVRLTGKVVSNGKFHAWIEREDKVQPSFPAPHDNTHTIGSISCGKKVIAVGSYDANSPTKQISYFSSAGPARDGRKKPEVAAPGHGIWAANSRTKTGVTEMSGTSMASPCVAGIIALMFEEAVARGLKLSINQTIQILTASVRRNPPSGTAWNDRYGYGRISAAKAIQAVINLSSGGGAGGGGGAQTKPKSKSKKRSKPR
jgi:subtilisin family serine protease